MVRPRKVQAQLQLSLAAKSALKVKRQIESVLGSVKLNIDQRALGKLNSGMRQAQQTGAQLGITLGKVNSNAQQVAATAKQLSQNMNNAGQQFGKAQPRLSRYNQTSAHAVNTTTKLTTASRGLVGQWGSMITTSTLLFGAITQLSSAMEDNLKITGQLLVNIGQIENKSTLSGRIQSLGQAARQSAARIGSDPQSTLSAAGVLAQAGLKVDKSTIRLISELSLSEQITNTEELGRLFVLINRTLGIEGPEATRRFFNALLESSKTSSASVQDLIEATSIYGNVIRNVGGDWKDLLALTSRAQSVINRNQNEISRGLTSISARLSSQVDLRNKLSQYGVEIFEFNSGTGRKEFVGVIEALDRINNLVRELGPTSQEGLDILTRTSGVRRSPILAGVLKALPQVKEFRKRLDQDIVDHVQNDVNVALESGANKLARLRNEFVNTMQTLSQSTAFQQMTKAALTLGSGILKLTDAFKEFVPLLGALAVGKLAGLGKVGATLRNVKAPTLPKTTSRIARDAGGYAIRPSQFGPGKARAQLFGQLEQYYRKQVRALKPNISAIDAQREALALANKAVRKNANVIIGSSGKIERVTANFGKRMTAYTKGLVRGKGALITGLASGALSTIGGDSPEVQSAVTGLNSAFASLLLGASGATAAIVGLGSAAFVYSRNVEDAANRLRSSKVGEALDSFTQTVNRFSLNTDQGRRARLGAGRKLVGSLTSQRAAVNTDDDLTGIGKYFRYVRQSAINLFKSDPINPALAAGKKRAEAFNESLRKAGPALLQYRDDLARTFATFGDFAASNQGKELLARLAEYDQALGAAYNTSLEETKRLFQVSGGLETVIRKQIDLYKSVNAALGETARAYSDATPDSLRSSNMGTFSLLPRLDFSTFGRSFQQSIGRLPSEFGGGDKVFLTQLNRLSKQLPKILSQSFEPETFRDAIKRSLGSAGFGQSLIDTIDSTLLGKIPETFLATLSDVNAASAKLIQEGFGPMLKNLQSSADAISQFRKAVAENYDTLASQGRTLTDSITNLQKLQADFTKTRRQFSGSQVYSNFGDIQARTAARNLAGTDDTKQLGKQLNRLTELFRETNDTRFATAIKTTKESLRRLSDQSLRTSEAMTQLQQLRSDRQARFGIAQKFYGSDIEGRVDLVRAMRETFAVASTGATFNDVAPDTSRRIIDLLSSMGSASSTFTRGIPADELLERITAKSLGVKYQPDAEKTLQREILTTQKDAIMASKLLVDHERSIMNKFVNDLNVANRNFLAGLSSVLRGRPMSAPMAPPTQALGSAPQPQMSGLNDVAQQFSGVSDQLNQAADKLRGLQVQHVHGGEISVIINGASVLQQLQKPLQDLIISKVSEGINNMLRARLPELSNPAEQWVGQWTN